MNMKCALACLPFLFLCLFSIQAHAAADKQLVGKIRDTYKAMNSFRADFEQTLTHKESGSREIRKGELQFQKPLQIRWQTIKPHEETLVATNREIWDYLPDEEIAYRYSPAIIQDSRSIIQVVTGQAALDKDFDVKQKGMENGLAKLDLYPKEPSTQMVEATIWVDPATGYIKRAKILDFYGNGNDVRFIKFNPNAKIPAKAFSFTPPKGVEVEDRVGKDIQERELFR